jgi:hypothetical protein
MTRASGLVELLEHPALTVFAFGSASQAKAHYSDFGSLVEA